MKALLLLTLLIVVPAVVLAQNDYTTTPKSQEFGFPRGQFSLLKYLIQRYGQRNGYRLYSILTEKYGRINNLWNDVSTILPETTTEDINTRSFDWKAFHLKRNGGHKKHGRHWTRGDVIKGNVGKENVIKNFDWLFGAPIETTTNKEPQNFGFGYGQNNDGGSFCPSGKK